MSTYPKQPPLTHRFVPVDIVDISTASSNWVVPGFRGRIKAIHSVINAAITSANAAITVEIGGTAVAGAALTIATAGSAAGDVDSAVVPVGATNSFTESQAIEVITDGGSSTTSKSRITLELEAT